MYGTFTTFIKLFQPNLHIKSPTSIEVIQNNESLFNVMVSQINLTNEIKSITS